MIVNKLEDYKTWVNNASSILDGWRAEIVKNASVKSIKTNDGKGFNLRVIVDGKGYEMQCWLSAFEDTKFSELVESIRNRGSK